MISIALKKMLSKHRVFRTFQIGGIVSLVFLFVSYKDLFDLKGMYKLCSIRSMFFLFQLNRFLIMKKYQIDSLFHSKEKNRIT